MKTHKRAVIQYYGGKSSIAPWIIAKMPPHRIYVEPYCGGASVFFQKLPAEREILNDLSSDIVNLFRVLRDNPDKLITALELTPYSREEFKSSYEPTTDPVERARRYMVRCGQGKSGARNTKTGWQIRSKSFGYNELSEEWNNLASSLQGAVDRLKHAMIEQDDALKIIERYDTPETLHYVDPPYVLSARREQTGNYTHEMTDQDHRELAKVLHGVAGMVMLSGYRSELYQELYGSWISYEVETSTVAKTTSTEVLWLNPAAATINTLPLFSGLQM